MSDAEILAAQRQLLDQMVQERLISTDRYFFLRERLADAPRICCARHSDRAALIYGPDDRTPLCGPCGVLAYEQERTV